MKNKKSAKKETKQSSKSGLVGRLEKTAWTLVKTVVDTTPNPFLILDSKLRVIVANKFFYQFFRVSSKETENKLIYKLGKGQWDIPKLRKTLEEILPKKTYFTNLEIEQNFPKIGKRIMLLNARQIYEKIGIPRTVFTPMILLVMEDITNLRKSQEKEFFVRKAIKEARAELEQQKEISKMKSEFVSLTSYQLRTPLTSMKWYSEMLLGGDVGELTPKQKKYVGELYQGNERMIDLVRNLLNVSRIEMGVLAVNLKPTDIGELLEEVAKEHTHFVKEKKHEVVIEIQEGMPKISTDPSLVRMIFQNLFGNAVEYTPQGGKITCTAEKKDKEIIIGIKDTGIGIPEKQQNQIFQKLFRGDNVIREHSEGTGLELYITKAMVDALSGKIWFKSKEGGGTTFWVVLPLKGPKTRSGQKLLLTHYGQTK
jgi:two-component system CheB/CheR fusion protein